MEVTMRFVGRGGLWYARDVQGGWGRLRNGAIAAILAAVVTLFGGAGGGLAGASEEDGGSIVILTIDSEISEGLPSAVRRSVERAEEKGSAALVIRLRTFGGRVSSATAIKDTLLDAEVPTLALVDRRAISAGALIALATNRIYMVPGSSIGAATPYRQGGGGSVEVSEKMTSALRSIFQATAAAKGHPESIAEAMVDADVSIPGFSEEGKLLTLSADEAVEVGLAASKVEGLEALLAAEGLADLERTEMAQTPAEKLADLLSSPQIAGLLLSIALWAIIAGFKIPGTGIAEIAALLALGAYLFGNHVAGLAGWEDIALVGAGAVLLALEIFVIPGTGVAGILGALALFTGLVMAAVRVSPSSPMFWPELQRGITGLGIGIGLAVLWTVVAFLALRKTRYWDKFTRADVAAARDRKPGGDRPPAEPGAIGRAVTALRPEGEVEIEGGRMSARAVQGYVDSGARVVVVGGEGKRLEVRAAEAEAEAREESE